MLELKNKNSCLYPPLFYPNSRLFFLIFNKEGFMKLNQLLSLVLASCFALQVNASHIGYSMAKKIKADDVQNVTKPDWGDGVERYSANLKDYSMITAEHLSNGKSSHIQRPGSFANEIAHPSNFDILKKEYAKKQVDKKQKDEQE
jgi:hypothetical protein